MDKGATFDDDLAPCDLVPPTEYCPVSIGVSLFGDRWSLLIVRELLVGATRFNEILWGLPGLSRSLLSDRLRRLERLDILRRTRADSGGRGGYELTEAGSALRPTIEAIGLWTLRWQFPAPSDGDANAALLLWRVAQGVPRSYFRRHRTCIEFRFTDNQPERGWIRLEGARSSVCFEYPGEEPDVTVIATPKTIAEVWYGHQTLDSATRAGAIRVAGASDLVASFQNWFSLSPFAQRNLSLHGYEAAPTTGSGSELDPYRSDRGDCHL